MASIRGLQWIFVGWGQYFSKPESDLFNNFGWYLLYTFYYICRLFYYKIVIVFIYFSILSIFLNTYWFIIYLDLGSWIYLSICLSSIYLYIFKPSLARIKRLRWIFVGWDQYSSPPESDLFNGFRCAMFYFILCTLNIVFFIIK